MAVTLIDPPGLLAPQGYTQVAIGTGSRIVAIAGQVGQDAAGDVVGPGDIAAQTEQAVLNVSIAFEAAGATFTDVLRTTIHVVGYRPEVLGPLFEGFGRAAAKLGIQGGGPTTMIGVESLASPDLLVEFDVTAVAA